MQQQHDDLEMQQHHEEEVHNNTDTMIPSPSGIHFKQQMVLPSERNQFLKQFFATLQQQQYAKKNCCAWCMPQRDPVKAQAELLYSHMNDAEQHQFRTMMMDLGYALMVFGAASYRVEYQLSYIAHFFGMDGFSVYVTPTGLFMSFAESLEKTMDGEVHMVATKENPHLDLSKLCEIDDIANMLASGTITVAQAKEKIKKASQHEHGWNRYLQDALKIAFMTLNAALTCIFFDGYLLEIAAGAISGFFVGFILVLATHVKRISKIARLLAAIASVMSAVIFKAVLCAVAKDPPIFNEIMIGIAGVILLTPGLSLMMSVTELSFMHLISGALRLMNALTALLQLGFGMLVGFKISALLQLPAAPLERERYQPWVYAIILAPNVVAFMVYFKVPRYPLAVICIAVASYLAFFGSFFTAKFVGSEIGSFVGTFFACLIGNIYSRITKHPSNVVTTASILMLVPGGIGVKVFQQMMLGNSGTSFSFVYSTMMIATALMFGFSLASVIVPSRHKIHTS